ncbi:MAG TPA: hypothetical protein VM598_07320 [Bdellovibrionota bacterium]|nr:hypothetical protein [Bdellovibrionota bacterium]
MRVIISNHDTWLPRGDYASPDGSPITLEASNRLILERVRTYARSSGCAPTGERRFSTGQIGWGVLAETIRFDCSASPRAKLILDVFDTTGWLGLKQNGHVWPGSPTYGGEYDATKAVWRFFEPISR